MKKGTERIWGIAEKITLWGEGITIEEIGQDQGRRTFLIEEMGRKGIGPDSITIWTHHSKGIAGTPETQVNKGQNQFQGQENQVAIFHLFWILMILNIIVYLSRAWESLE